MSRREAKLPGWWTLAKDIATFLGGWVIMFMELQRPVLRESVLLLAAGIVGIPAGSIALQTLADIVVNRRPGTGGSSGSSPEQASSVSQS